MTQTPDEIIADFKYRTSTFLEGTYTSRAVKLLIDAYEAKIEAYEAKLTQTKLEYYNEGLRAFAWWKDGEQYVGTCGTKLKDALFKEGDI